MVSVCFPQPTAPKFARSPRAPGARGWACTNVCWFCLAHLLALPSGARSWPMAAFPRLLGFLPSLAASPPPQLFPPHPSAGSACFPGAQASRSTQQTRTFASQHGASRSPRHPARSALLLGLAPPERGLLALRTRRWCPPNFIYREPVGRKSERARAMDPVSQVGHDGAGRLVLGSPRLRERSQALAHAFSFSLLSPSPKAGLSRHLPGAEGAPCLPASPGIGE